MASLSQRRASCRAEHPSRQGLRRAAATLSQHGATALGQPDFAPEAIGELLELVEMEPLPPEGAAQGQRALGSPTGLTEPRSSSTRRDVVQAWCERLAHGGDVAEIEQLADQLLASEDVVVWLAMSAASLPATSCAAPMAVSLRRPRRSAATRRRSCSRWKPKCSMPRETVAPQATAR